MENSQLRQYLKDSGYTLGQAAAKVGFTYVYMAEILNGTKPLTDSARFKIVRAFPDTAVFLLQLELPILDVHNPEVSR